MTPKTQDRVNSVHILALYLEECDRKQSAHVRVRHRLPSWLFLLCGGLSRSSSYVSTVALLVIFQSVIPGRCDQSYCGKRKIWKVSWKHKISTEFTMGRWFISNCWKDQLRSLTQHPVGPHVSYRFVLILGHFKTAISDETI